MNHFPLMSALPRNTPCFADLSRLPRQHEGCAEQAGHLLPHSQEKLDELLLQLNLRGEEESEAFDMSLFTPKVSSSTKASDIVRSKLYENGGRATVYSVTGKPYIIRAAKDGCSFLCSELPMKPPYTYDVFDVIVDLLLREGGSARKGMGRNSPLGEGGCTEDTVVGAIGKYYLKPLLGNMCLTLCLCWRRCWIGRVLLTMSVAI